MPRLFITVVISLLSAVSAIAQAPDDLDRAALSSAWQSYAALIDEGNYEASLEHAKQVLELAERLFSKSDKQLAAATVNYGENLLYLGRLEESTKVFRLALKRYQLIYGEDAAELMPVLLSLASASVNGPKNRSQEFLDRAEEILDSRFDVLSLDYADAAMSFATTSLCCSPSVETAERVQKAREIYVAQLGPAEYRFGLATAWLGAFYADRNELEVAQRYLDEAIGVFDPSDPTLLGTYIETRLLMMNVLERRGMNDEANAQLAAIGRATESIREFGYDLPIVRVAPYYPASALRAGKSGYVDLIFTVDENGYVTDPEVVGFAGSKSFEPAAIAAALKFRYIPLYVDGVATAQPGVKTRITFELQN